MDVKYFAASTVRYTLPPGTYEISDINSMVRSLLPNELKVNITIDDVRQKSNLTTNKTIRFTRKSFFYTNFGFTQPQSGLLAFIQRIPGIYKSYKRLNITGIDKVHLKCDCVDRSVLNGTRQLFLYSFALDKPPGNKIFKEPRIKLFTKINKSVLSHNISFRRWWLYTKNFQWGNDIVYLSIIENIIFLINESRHDSTSKIRRFPTFNN